MLKMFELLNELANEMENVAEDIKLSDVADVLEQMVSVRQIDEDLKYVKKRYADLFKRYKEEIVPSKFEEEGISSITIDGYRYTVSVSSRTSIISSEKQAAYAWLIENGLEDIITETVNSSTLSATARTLMEDGVELPEELFKLYTFNNTSMTKK